MTSVFSGEVLKKPKERQILPEKAQKNIHKNVQKKVQQLSAQEVEKCIEACVTGCKVQHRKYGTGEIISGDGRIAEILFLGENNATEDFTSDRIFRADTYFKIKQ